MGFFSSLWHGAGELLHGAVKIIGEGVHDVVKYAPEILAVATAIPSLGASLTALTGSQILADVAAGIPTYIRTVFVNGVRTLKTFAAPIVHSLSRVYHAAQTINNDIYKPIIAPIQQIVAETKTVLAAVKSESQRGIVGYLQIPTTIENAFGDLSSITTRVGLAQIASAKQTAETIIGPAILSASHDDLVNIHDVISDYTQIPGHALTSFPADVLQQPPDLNAAYAHTEEIINELRNGTSWVDKFAQRLLSLLFIGPMFLAHLSATETEVKQQVHSQSPVELLPLNVIVEGLKRGELDGESARLEHLKHGLDETRFGLLRELAQKLLSPGEAIEANFRQVLSETDLINELKHNGYDDTRIATLRELSVALPTVNDAMLWYARAGLSNNSLLELLARNKLSPEYSDFVIKSAYSPPPPALYNQTYPRMVVRDQGFLSNSFNQDAPAAVKANFSRNLQSEDSANLGWLAHWKNISAGDWINAGFRGLVTSDDIKLGLESLGYPDELTPILHGLEEELLPIWMIPDILGTGLVSDAAGEEMLIKLGIDAANRKIMLEYGKSKSNGKLAANTEALHQLSLANLHTMLIDGLIDKAQYNQGLQDHGYSTETSALLTQLVLDKLELTERRALANTLINEYKAGLKTYDDTKNALYNQGFSDGEIAKYLVKMGNIKTDKSKTPNETDLNNMLTKNIIDKTTWGDVMLNYGYSPTWIERIYQLKHGVK